MVLELAPQSEDLTVEFENVFARWRQALIRQFELGGIAAGKAADLAELVEHEPRVPATRERR